MDETKISIIIPVYNVEPFLRRCLDSVVSQTCRNLQIILIDDGSPDRCGEICDAYAAADSRISVIHKENGGVSSARNAGLAEAEGEWIGWVDPDDWIEPDMFEYLLKKAVESGADIAMCGRYEQYEDRSVPRTWAREELFTTEAALELLLKNDIMQNYLCDKLWRRELFDGVVFPEGKTFEDVAVMHRLFERAEHVICLPEIKYNYYQRSGSIVGDVSLGNQINYYDASRVRYEDMRERWPQFSPLLEGQCVASAVGIWTSFLLNSKEEQKKYLPELMRIAEFAKNHYKAALRHSGFGYAGKAVVLLTMHADRWAFVSARLISLLYKMKNGEGL